MSSDTGPATAATAATPALAVEELVAGYGGVIALDRVSISAGTAAITAVLGANGAGKTTLLRAISGMIKPRRGRIRLDGTDLAGRNPADGPGRDRPRARGAGSDPRADRRGEPADRHDVLAGRDPPGPRPVPRGPRRRPRRGLRALPAAGRPAPQARRRPVRRRAADARHRASAAGAAARAVARRAVARPGAPG